MFDTNKMKRAAKRKRDKAIKQCKKEYGHKGPKKIRKKIKFEDEAA